MRKGQHTGLAGERFMEKYQMDCLFAIDATTGLALILNICL
jgi:hypothetical protein